MTDYKINEPKNEVNLTPESLFQLQCIIKADIKNIAENEFGQSQFLAFVTADSDLGLYYIKEHNTLPYIKRIPWFLNPNRKIAALCFDPQGIWLFIASVDTSIFILPAKSLVDEEFSIEDEKWTTADITTFAAFNAYNSINTPSALVWWKGVSFSGNLGIIGTEEGEIVFVDLEAGTQVSVTKVEGKITKLSVYHDTQIDTVVLLITNDCKIQWQLVLEKPSTKYIYHLSKSESNIQQHTPQDDTENDESKNFPTARSRLRGLKQLSVEKLVILKQKIAESRNRNFEPTPAKPGPSNSNSSQVNSEQVKDNNDSINETDTTSQQQQEFSIKCTSDPVAMSNDMYIFPQNFRNVQTIFTRFLPSTNFIFIHENSLLLHPSHTHKMPEQSDNILLTNQFFYVTDVHQKSLYIVSQPLSEIKKNDKFEFNEESLVGKFTFKNSNEFIIKFFLVANSKNNSCSYSNIEKNSYNVAKSISDLKINVPYIDSCIVVTNLGVYKLVLCDDIISILLDLILKKKAVEEASKLALTFGLDVQQLIEYAGDIVLCNREINRAMSLYYLAGSRLAKTILKFASIGYTSELLSCLVSYLTPPAISELSIVSRIHFSNLCVLAYTELVLRTTSPQRKQLYKDFLKFLSKNSFYDELLAVNIASQTNLWHVLHHLAIYRGLYAYLLDTVVKVLPNFPLENFSTSISRRNLYDLLICISEASLIQDMLINPSTSKSLIAYILSNLPHFDNFILQRLISLFDPSNPAIRPLVLRCKAHKRTISRSSVSSQCDSLDLSEELDEINMLVEEFIELFLQILLTLIQKKQLNTKFVPKFMLRTQFPHSEEFLQHKQSNVAVDFKRRLLSVGFGHTALIRNNNVYTWGNCTQGCLGTGSTISRYNTPQAICTFRKLGIEVLSVSCGKCHTLAVTNNGVYSWGGSTYGQLGLGKLLQCPNPQLITSLSEEIIVEAVAGQYHSVALTADGRVFSWGWGVHGQLGHGNTEAKNLPTIVKALLGINVKYVSAGHAHTIVLSADGFVYAFGCNIFGQLGTGEMTKSCLPVKISLLPEKITLISTKYFHNLAISGTNNLYTWGASPQVLRQQSQAQKKLRMQARAAAAAAAAAAAQSENQESINANISHNNQEELDNKNKICNDLNTEMIEENQDHLLPILVDTNLVEGKIVQISTGCHHSALLTKDGTVYTWGKNLDGQIGNGTRREVLVPTPLLYDSASVFANIPPRLKNIKDQMEKNENKTDVNISDSSAESESCLNNFSRLMKAVKICCGSDFTIVIQPGGNVLAWGNNNMCQLGRAPATAKDPIRGPEEKVFLLKSSKRIIRHVTHTVIESPIQVPGIPSPIISYQSYDVTPLAGKLRPLIYIDKFYSDLTLHYTLEQFHGLYNFSKILEKSTGLKNYQACAKIEFLENNLIEALNYQLKALENCEIKNLDNFDDIFDENVNANFQKNEALFEKHIEKNIVDTLVESVNKQQMKMSVSKSLDSFQFLDQELHTFDCQGGSEELFDNLKCDDFSIDEDVLGNDNKEECKTSINYGAHESDAQDLLESQNFAVKNCADADNISNANNILKSEKTYLIHHATRIIDFHLYEIEDESYASIYEMLKIAINFWLDHNLPMNELEKLFTCHLKKLFYILGLLIFCQYDFFNKNDNIQKNGRCSFVKNAINLFSSKFCIQVCSMLTDHIDQGKGASEYIEMLSLSMAKNYGPPLTGYPGTNENKTIKSMMEGIISTISGKFHDPKPFIHIKDPNKISQLINSSEDSMIFTCGHSFLMSKYKSEIIPRMEAELLSLDNPLPATAEFLSSTLQNSCKPETLCPICLPQIFKNVLQNSLNR